VTGVKAEIKKINHQYDIMIGCLDYEKIDLWEMLNLKDDVIKITIRD